MPMTEQYYWIIPEIETGSQVAEVILAHQVAYDFYQEVEHRKAWQDYVQRYRAMAQQHQQELESMRRDVNVMGWFVRSRRD